jgi:heavy metal efflux system protein
MRTLTIVLLLASSLNAQSQLSLDQALSLGLKNNGDVQTSQFQIDANRELKKTGVDLGKTTVMGMFGQYNSYASDNNLTISQTIPFTALGSQAALNRSLLASSELKKQVTENELVFQIKQVYYSLAYLQARNQLLLQQDSLYEGFLKSATLRYKTGEGNLLEQTTAEAQRNEVRNQLKRNESNMIVLRTQLKTLLNAGSLPEIVSVTLEEIKFEDLPDTTLVIANPSLAYMRQTVDVARSQKNLEMARFAPDLLVGYFNQTLIRTPNPESGVFSTSNTRFSGFQLGLAIPLWFVPHQGKVKSAEFSRQAAQTSFRYYQKTLTGQAEQAIQRYQQGKNSLEYYKTSALPNADLILKQAQLAFRNGEIGYAEYLLGVRNAISIKEGYLQTLNDYNQSIIYIDFLSGVK